jgi:hypothetical protein
LNNETDINKVLEILSNRAKKKAKNIAPNITRLPASFWAAIITKKILSRITKTIPIIKMAAITPPRAKKELSESRRLMIIINKTWLKDKI